MIDQSIEILRRRVDETGTIEPTIVRQGDDRILLQVPGIKDTTDLKRKINQTAKLTFHLVNEDMAAAGQNVPATCRPPPSWCRRARACRRCARPTPRRSTRSRRPIRRLTPEQICRRYQPHCLPVFKRVVVGGEDLDDAKATFEQQQGGRPIISFTFNAAGGRAFCAATRQNIGKRLAIQLDNEIISAPVVQSAICGGSGIITGSSPPSRPRSRRCCCARARCRPRSPSSRSARSAPTSAPTPSMPARSRPSSARRWSSSSCSLIYGPLFGGFANLAMMVNMLLVFAGMSVLGASLTLPGIAGLVLTVGMSVDSNVLIYERVREETEQRPLAVQRARHRLRARADRRHRLQPDGADRRRPAVRLRLGPDPRLRDLAVARPADPSVHRDDLHPHAAGRLGALAAADRTRDLRAASCCGNRIHLVPANTKFDFLGKRRCALGAVDR